MKNPFEKKIARQLRRAKVKFKYEGIKIPYVLSGHYIPDFVIHTPTGYIYVETKGYLRPADKRKMVAVRRQHPEIDLRILFYASRKEQIRWATKVGIKYAVGKIPKEWMEGI